MKKILVLLAFILSFSGNCHADSGARDSIEKMLELTDAKAMVDSTYAQMEKMFSHIAKENTIDDDKKPIYEKHRKELHALLVESMSWDKIKEPMIKIYSQVYTKAEIDELNVFYQSPLGQKMIKKMPEVMQATMQVMQEFAQSMIPKMQALQKKQSSELVTKP
jgi:hypothetical protein